MPFQYNLRSLRQKEKLTQQQLGNVLHLSRNAISNYELGKQEPSLETLKNIAHFFGVTVD